MMLPRTTVLVGAFLLLIVPSARVVAQTEQRRLYSMPVAPPREVLDRLNLQMSYRIYVPMDGRHDGLTTVQLRGGNLYVQTRSGLVALIDAETGATRWRQRVGRAYVAEHGLAFNSREVYVVNNVYLYALNRSTGGVNWSTRLPEGVSSAPVADENMIFLPSQTGRLYAYMLPRPELLAAAMGGEAGAARKETPEERRQRIVSVRPESTMTTAPISHLMQSVREAGTEEDLGATVLLRSWTEVSSLRLELPLILTEDRLIMPTPNGVVAGLTKLPNTRGAPNQVYRFDAESSIRVPAGYYENVAYLGAEDANVYALETPSGRVRWRHTAGTAISRQPAVTEEDVYIVTERLGMTRLDRATGEPRWRIPVRGNVVENNSAADRFLAANPKYVYAVDFSGRFLVLDRRRGVTLGGFDTRDFVFPVSNTTTDRIFLAANNGLIVCLHDREYARPIRHRLREEEAANPLRQRLAESFSDIGTKEMPLREMIDMLTKRFPPLRFRIDEVAFQAAGRDSPAGDAVKIPKVNDKPMGTVIRDMLATIKCRYEVIGDTLLILPVAP